MREKHLADTGPVQLSEPVGHSWPQSNSSVSEPATTSQPASARSGLKDGLAVPRRRTNITGCAFEGTTPQAIRSEKRNCVNRGEVYFAILIWLDFMDFE